MTERKKRERPKEKKKKRKKEGGIYICEIYVCWYA